MMISSFTKRAHSNISFTLGLLISLVAITHLPARIQPGAFDRDAAPQFVVLCLVGVFLAAYCGLKKNLDLEKNIIYTLSALLITATISLYLSDSFTTSLIGDTGRYSGYASLLAFVSIAVAATRISERELKEALLGLSVGIILVTLLGLMQAFNVITLPTGGGVGSTLGNLDFLSAWIGTTCLLVFLTFREYGLSWHFSAIYFLIAIIVMWKLDAKQGFLDLIITVFFVGLFQLYIRSNIPGISAMGWKAISTFFLLLWSEAIFLIPMAKLPFPGVSSDPQVAIRSDFWFSATHMFVNHLGFGVGPDNYGNYYEKFRSLHSVKSTEFVLANDAHSSMLQTFATLGIFATLAYLLLILFTIYSAIDLYKASANRRYLFILLAFLVFYTNALISPITLPNKAIFWLLAGFLIGERARLRIRQGGTLLRVTLIVPSLLVGSTLVFALFSFVPSFISINSALAKNHSNQKVDYKVSNSLPCIVYTNTQLNLIAEFGGDVPQAAKEILRNHPRCLDALGFLAQDALSKKDYQSARPLIYQLLDVAPARQSVVRLAAIYAMGSGDESLKNLLTSQGLKLGILTQTQLK